MIWNSSKHGLKMAQIKLARGLVSSKHRLKMVSVKPQLGASFKDKTISNRL